MPLVADLRRFVDLPSALLHATQRGTLCNQHKRDNQHDRVDNVRTDQTEIRTDQPYKKAADQTAAVTMLEAITVSVDCRTASLTLHDQLHEHTQKHDEQNGCDQLHDRNTVSLIGYCKKRSYEKHDRKDICNQAKQPEKESADRIADGSADAKVTDK